MIASPVRASCAAFHSIPRRWQGSLRNLQPAAVSRQPAPWEGWAGPQGAPAVPLLPPPSRLPKILWFMVGSFKMSFLFPQVCMGDIPCLPGFSEVPSCSGGTRDLCPRRLCHRVLARGGNGWNCQNKQTGYTTSMCNSRGYNY